MNPSHVGLDEIHAHKTADLLNVLQSAAGARGNPLWLFTTTEGYTNPGPWAEIRMFAKKLLSGLFGHTADHYLVVFYAVDDEDKNLGIKADDEFDESCWIKANPLMDANPHLLTAIRKEAVEAKQMPSKMAEFRIKRLNRAPAQKLIGVLALAVMLMAGSAAVTWQVQDWRYGKQLAEQAGLHQEDLDAIRNAAAAQVRADQDKRLALEQRLAANDQTHHKELTDAQTNQARLRDRLATSDLRLSVLVDAADSASGCSVPASPGAGGVVHGGARARLDPAHAQRIVAISGDGDAGLIALAACQAYAREVSR